jgi:plasmid stabilization system protein ParE
MRLVRLSKTYDDELEALLAQGLPRFGVAVVRRKRDLVERAIVQVLARQPKRPNLLCTQQLRSPMIRTCQTISHRITADLLGFLASTMPAKGPILSRSLPIFGAACLATS